MVVGMAIATEVCIIAGSLHKALTVLSGGSLGMGTLVQLRLNLCKLPSHFLIVEIPTQYNHCYAFRHHNELQTHD